MIRTRQKAEMMTETKRTNGALSLLFAPDGEVVAYGACFDEDQSPGAGMAEVRSRRAAAEMRLNLIRDGCLDHIARAITGDMAEAILKGMYTEGYYTRVLTVPVLDDEPRSSSQQQNTP
jgi:hypothetical protein